MPDTRKGSRGEVIGVDSFRLIMEENKSELLGEIRKINESLDCIRTKMSGMEATLGRVLETQKRQDAEMRTLKNDFHKIKQDYDNIMHEVEERETGEGPIWL